MTREEQLFGEALALPVAERAAFLERACADDPALRERVARLLSAYAESDQFMAGWPGAQLLPQAEEKPGDRVGGYTLVRKLGEGGCGVVYLAEQHEPVRRQVALKIIKLGLDTRQIVARFDAERQALAMMDHPDIAKVFDAGSTAAGRPFFAMEYVDGVPITKFCDEQRLGLEGRLELMARVCVALQHAHQKGIVHRDVKPSNILVTLRDGVPAPKVIDFGIAKATAGRLSEHTFVTGFEQMIGTPTYMSPEQVERRDLDIDTRSDIYSLGVLLYELLAGRPPFDVRTLMEAGIDEVRRIIREVDPPRPSIVVSTLGAGDRATLSGQRRAAPSRLTSVLRGDLDWIVMRCLEKDRARRYDTAGDLAADLRRHLRNEPVEARPPELSYRVRKFVRRHRVACAGVAAVALALVAGAVVSTWQAIRATRAEHVARLAQADALRRQGEAEDLLAFMLGDFRAELAKIGRLKLLDAVGDKATAYFAALDPRDQTDTTLLRHAKALTQIGEIRMDQARYPDALAAFTAACRRATELATRHPRDADVLFQRAQAEYWIGYVAWKKGDIPAAREWLTRYRDSAETLGRLEPDSQRARNELAMGAHNLAVLEAEQDNLAAARQSFSRELALCADLRAKAPADVELQFRTTETLSWLANIAERSGDYAESSRRYADTLAEVGKLIALQPEVARWRFRQAHSLSFVADLQVLRGDFATAEETYRHAVAVMDELVGRDPKNLTWRLEAVVFGLRLVVLESVAQPEERSLRTVQELRALAQTLVASEPTSRSFRRSLATSWRIEAALLFRMQQPGAVEAAARACDLSNALLEAQRGDYRMLGEWAQAHLLAGRIARYHGEPDQARQHWRQIVDQLAPRCAESNDWRYLDPVAQSLILLGDSTAARPLTERLQRFGYHSPDPLAAQLFGTPIPPP